MKIMAVAAASLMLALSSAYAQKDKKPGHDKEHHHVKGEAVDHAHDEAHHKKHDHKKHHHDHGTHKHGHDKAHKHVDEKVDHDHDEAHHKD